MFAGDKYALATGPEGLIQTYGNFFRQPVERYHGRHSREVCNNQIFNFHFKATRPGITQADLTQAGEPANLWRLWILLPHPTNQAVSSPDEKTLPPPWQMVLLCAPASTAWLSTWIKTAMNAQAGLFFTCTLPPNNAPRLAQNLEAGDLIGYPSCEGGRSTGSHVHIARKYNGEWIIADSAIPFKMSGWVVHNGSREYLGTLTKDGATVTACECGDLTPRSAAAVPVVIHSLVRENTLQ